MPKLGNPLPQPLPKECTKASRIFKSFVDSGNNGLDGVIPRSVLEGARGFAIFTIFKAGFLFSARGGGGVVIARLDDGSWSAPSAIGLAGLGVGGQAGAEMTDFLIVLNSRSAVSSFMAAGSLTLGGNMSLAVGPLGRNGEASGTLSTSGKVAAMYSYSKTRGLFGGVSVEGSVIVERQDANATAYRSNVSAKQILSGSITPPDWAQPLISTLEACTGTPGGRSWISDGQRSPGSQYAFNGIASPDSQAPPSLRKQQQRKGSNANTFPPNSWGARRNSGSYFGPPSEDTVSGSAWDYDQPPRIDNDPPPAFETRFDSDFMPEARSKPRHTPSQSLDMSSRSSSRQLSTHSRSFSNAAGSSNPFYSQAEREDDPYNIRTPYGPTLEEDDPFGPGTHATDAAAARYRETERNRALSKPLTPGEGIARGIALFDFRGVEQGDLSFLKGQVITITEKTESTDTWWKGRLEGREGSFPANFVEVV